MAFTENLNQFFDTDDFAVSAVINTNPSRTINVIFETPTEETEIYNTAIESNAPFLQCKTSDLSGVSRTNTVAIAGTVYKIGLIRHSGSGTSLVFLKT